MQLSSDGSLQAVTFCRSPRRQGLVHPDEQDWRTHCSRWEEDPNFLLQRSLLRADRVPPFHPAPMWVSPVMDEEAPADFEAAEAEPGDELPFGLKINAPVRPTRKELEEHSVSHFPFRSWCEACIRGKAKANPHKRVDHSDEAAIYSHYWRQPRSSTTAPQ